MMEDYGFKLHCQERCLFGMGYLSKDLKCVRERHLDYLGEGHTWYRE